MWLMYPHTLLSIEVPEPAHDVTDGPTVHYLALENEERNQISITSGNLALYEVCLLSALWL